MPDSYPCEVWRVPPEATTQRTVAYMGFVVTECIIPSSVVAGKPFDIQIKYKLYTIETRNPDGNLAHFPGYDGMYYRYRNPAHTAIEYWVWRLQQMGLSFMENPPTIPNRTSFESGEIQVDEHGRGFISPGDEFTYTFHGTIEDLLGREFISATTVHLCWSIYGLVYSAHEPSDWWPWNWTPPESSLDFSRVCFINYSIQVLPPPPPTPLPILTFDTNLCSVSKSQVAPNESFTIKVTLDNTNQGAGVYEIGYYCSGSYVKLTTGTIQATDKTKAHTFSVTANQLANQEITESEILGFTIAVLNDNGTTGSLPLAIPVIVTGPAPETGTLSGRITDKKTGLALSGVSISAVGKTVTTDSSGNYTFAALSVGSYSVKFSKSGYWEITQSAMVTTSGTTLNIALTPTSEPQPSGGTAFPWIPVVAVMAGAVIVTLAISKTKKYKGAS